MVHGRGQHKKRLPLSTSYALLLNTFHHLHSTHCFAWLHLPILSLGPIVLWHLQKVVWDFGFGAHWER